MVYVDSIKSIYYRTTFLGDENKMWLAVERDSNISIIRQVYGEIKLMILDGKLTAGSKLPSTFEKAIRKIFEVYFCFK